MNQRGFLSGAMLYGVIGAVAIMGALGIALKIQSSRLDACKAEYAAFRIETKRLGEAADAERKRIDALNLKAKEKADADHKATVDRLNLDLKRMRLERARGGGLSQAAAVAPGVDRTCFDPEKLATALRVLDQGLLEIAGDGQEAIDGLNAAKAWAKEIQ